MSRAVLRSDHRGRRADSPGDTACPDLDDLEDLEPDPVLDSEITLTP